MHDNPMRRLNRFYDDGANDSEFEINQENPRKKPSIKILAKKYKSRKQATLSRRRNR